MVKVRIAAPASEGQANKALIRFLARCLGLSASHIRIVHGGASRHKVVEIDGLDHEAIASILDSVSR
ncbi:MAG: hypothetical protein NVS4B2_08310 [Chloroflexota bacterium]